MPLDLTKWNALSDGDLVDQPRMAGNPVFTANRMALTMSDAVGDGPLLYLPFGEDLLDVRLERTVAGKQERRTPAGMNFSFFWTRDPNQYHFESALSGWYSEDAINARYYAGAIKSIDLESTADGSGTWTVEISTPYWWGFERDVAELLFTWLRYYTPQAAATLQYLDRDALIEFSAIMSGHLNGARFFEFRRVGKTIADRVRSLSRQGRTLLGWGGFQAGSSTVQQLGLRALAREELERSTLTFDLSVGRDMFLTSTPDIRTADELIVNSLATRWGSLTKVVETIEGGFWDPQNHTNTLEEPQELIGKDNEELDEDVASIAARGSRAIENDAPQIIDQQVAQAIHRPWLWIAPKRMLSFPMGPLHLDFDTGAVISASDPSLGLDGTEDLLVIGKKRVAGPWHAEIRCVEMDDQLPPAIPPTDPSIAATLGLWLEGDTGVVVDGGGNITKWTDISGQGNDALYSARISPTVNAPRVDFSNLNGKQIVSFNYTQSATDKGLDLNGMTSVLNNSTEEEQTWMFLCAQYGTRVGNSWLYSVNDVSTAQAEASIGYTGTTATDYALELDGTITDAKTESVTNGEFIRGGYSHGTAGTPWYILVVQKRNWGSAKRIALHKIGQDFKVERKLDLYPSTKGWNSLELEANACLGCKHDATNGEGFMGLMAAVAAFAGTPDPKHILGVARWWINKWGPIG